MPKREILVIEEEYSDHFYFGIHGGVRASYLKDGKTITAWFAFENDFVSTIISFFLVSILPLIS